MWHRFLSLLLAAVIGSHAAAQVQAPVRSATRLALGEDNILFVADWRALRIHPIALPVAGPASGKPFNLRDIEAPIARALHAAGRRLRFEDMVAQPATGRVFIAVSVLDGRSAPRPAVVSVDADGTVKIVDLQRRAGPSAVIADAPAPDLRFWRDLPGQSLTITDMLFDHGRLYVAGLSSRAFASTLRVYDYPFDGKVQATTVEMYHPVHNQVETRAPVRRMVILRNHGKPLLVAAYTCTPLVTIPLEDLHDGAHIVGKTIAELGWGSEPVGMVRFESNGEEYVLLANSSRSADLLTASSIAAASTRPGVTDPIEWPAQPLAGVRAVSLPMSAVAKLSDFNKDLLVALRRDDASGAMQLVTIPKGGYLRLSDFVNEYDFPGFQYRPDDGFHAIHKTLRALEGYPELVR